MLYGKVYRPTMDRQFIRFLKMRQWSFIVLPHSADLGYRSFTQPDLLSILKE